MAAKVEQTHDELLTQLDEQRRFLASSCAAFDAGDHAEAQRIATTLRVLLDHLGNSRALLVRLGTRDQIGWLDTAGSMLPFEAASQAPLVTADTQERAEERPDQTVATWLPTLDAWDRRLQKRRPLPPYQEETLARMRAEHRLRSRGSWLPFSEWWEADVLRDGSGQIFTRADLLRAVADTDGVARVDSSFDEFHQRPSSPISTGWVVKLKDPDVPLLSPALASVRQVAFEVERSLLRQEAAA